MTGVWSGGRIGTLHALRSGSTPSKVIAFGSKAVAEQKAGGDYAPLVREIIKFFQTGVAPVSAEETLEKPSYSLRNARKMGFEMAYLRPNYLGTFAEA